MFTNKRIKALKSVTRAFKLIPLYQRWQDRNQYTVLSFDSSTWTLITHDDSVIATGKVSKKGMRQLEGVLQSYGITANGGYLQ